MKKKIDKLSAEQTRLLVEYRDKWTAIGLSTEPADRPRAERAIVEMYKIADLAPPKIVWCKSPLSQALTWAVIDENKLLSSGASVWDSVGASVRDSVRASVGASVRDSVWASVGASVRDSVGASVRASVGASVWASVYGQHEAGFAAFYDFFNQVCDLKDATSKARGIIELAQSTGWILPMKDICWVSERHNVLNRDSDGKLHCETGPAVAYPDGFEIYAIHGTRFDWQDVINVSPTTFEKISKNYNKVQQRDYFKLIFNLYKSTDKEQMILSHMLGE